MYESVRSRALAWHAERWRRRRRGRDGEALADGSKKNVKSAERNNENNHHNNKRPRHNAIKASVYCIVYAYVNTKIGLKSDEHKANIIN